MKKEQSIRVTVKTVPHPNPQSAIDLIAEIVVNQLLFQSTLSKRERLGSDFEEEGGVDEPSAAAN